MRAQARVHRLAINPVIYAEISLSFSTLEALDDIVGTLGLQMRELPRQALSLAAKAFAQYRRRGGNRLQVVPDLFIRARAAVVVWPLVTRNRGTVQDAFSDAGPCGAVSRGQDAWGFHGDR